MCSNTTISHDVGSPSISCSAHNIHPVAYLNEGSDCTNAGVAFLPPAAPSSSEALVWRKQTKKVGTPARAGPRPQPTSRASVYIVRPCSFADSGEARSFVRFGQSRSSLSRGADARPFPKPIPYVLHHLRLKETADDDGLPRARSRV